MQKKEHLFLFIPNSHYAQILIFKKRKNTQFFTQIFGFKNNTQINNFAVIY